MKSYDDLNDNEKKQLIIDEYQDNKLSFGAISTKYNTYANKVRRDAVRLKIPIRNKSEAQKTALEYGRHQHPTKGQVRSDEVKDKIGAAVLNAWDSISPQELDRRKQIAKDNWNKLSDDERAVMLHKANLAVRQSSDNGSKLELYLMESLLEAGLKVDFHKEQVLVNTKLQIDLFLPTMNIAIEVDGPSHYAPVWGEDVLQKNIKYDNKKNGLLIGKGLALIRIKQNKDFSRARAKMVFDKLMKTIDLFKNATIPTEKYFELGDE